MKVPVRSAQTEFQVKGSKFISLLQCCESAEAAKAMIEEAWGRFPDATHIVYAYRVGKTGELLGLSDDGEPHGTAGRPVIEVLKGSELTNTLIMVVRYFGGTKLGTGGLVRAYTQAAQQVLARTPTEELREMTHFAIRLAYPFLEQAKLLLQANSAKIEKEAYGTEVVILGSVPIVELDRLREELAELSSGQIRIEIESSESQRDAGEFGRST